MYASEFVHPVRVIMEDHEIQNSIAAKACAMSPSCFSSKLSGKLRWNAHEATAILTLLRWFEKGLTCEQMFPPEVVGVSAEEIHELASQEKAVARRKRKRLAERELAIAG